MLDDSSRVIDTEDNTDGSNTESKGGVETIKRELKTKEEIKNYVKGIL